MHQLAFTREGRVVSCNTAANIRSAAMDSGLRVNRPIAPQRAIGALLMRLGKALRLFRVLGDKVLTADCGGRGLCCTCRVEVADETPLGIPTVFERLWRSVRRIRPNQRLACQARVYGNATVQTMA